MARLLNRGRVAEQLARIPDSMKRVVQQQGDIEARYLANAVRAAAPVGTDLEHHPGELRDSVHVEAGKRALSWRVVIDAKDERGHCYARHVEFGHMAKGGVHVAPVPFAYPTKRIEWPGMKKRLKRAGREGARLAAPELMARYR